ncbi:MAG: Asp-tRNA(Asn)/Glu-tRNA(Gln) amidotransferase subunit GatA [Propionibacteriaceae bacterium]|nr:Asp-tRNA(Asn)/Glu-tRNA(Gln) amidotransferase subunit GatA [Propionibacteriaceae bacterium]
MKLQAPENELLTKSAAQLAALIKAGEVSSREVVAAHLQRIADVEPQVHAFLSVDAERALAAADRVDAKRMNSEPLGSLAGVPLAMKDNYAYQGLPCTCGSRMLEGWYPPYDATVTKRLLENDIIILGKTNLDEFAMGSATENSAFGVTCNPHDLERIPGGSGGGSAASLAAFEAPLAVGSDTGGSIRQPASVTGTIGIKPTYGGISRFGIVALASSLDAPGPCARTVMDAALLHQTMAGYDRLDSVSINAPIPAAQAAASNPDLRGLKLGVVKEFTGEWFQSGVMGQFDQALTHLVAQGAEIVEVSCPHFEVAMGANFLIMAAEISSNMAKFDAVRYGLRSGDDGQHSAQQVTSLSRGAGFGAEVKRRILLGTHALSTGHYEALYGSALKVRTLVIQDFDAAFSKVDVLVSPTSPVTAWKIGERSADPLTTHHADLCTVPSNLAGNCAGSFPIGVSADDGLPVGFQVIAPAMGDALLYRVGAGLENAFGVTGEVL